MIMVGCWECRVEKVKHVRDGYRNSVSLMEFNPREKEQRGERIRIDGWTIESCKLKVERGNCALMVRGLLELLEAQRRTCFYGAEQVDLDAAGMIAANQRESSDRQK